MPRVRPAPASPYVWTARAALAAWALLTAWVALAGPGGGRALLVKDEIDHVVFVAGLALLSGLSFPRARLAWVALAWTVPALGFEFVQHWIAPVREASLRDVLTSLLGVAFGCAALAWVRIATDRP